MHIHYNYLYGHSLAEEPPTVGHEINNYGRPFLCTWFV